MPKFIHTILLYLACLLMAPLLMPSVQAQKAASKPQQKTIRVTTLNRVQYLYMEDVASFYGFKMTVKGKNIVLSSKYSRLVFTNDGRIATINTADQYLAFSVRTQNGHVLLSLIDFQKVIDPILRPGTIPRHVVRKIIIDPGHGGKDPGCLSGVVKEKDVNLQVSLRLADLLRKRGYTVYMTRQSDIYPTLDQRVNAANRIKPDLYISLHCNSTANASINGIEVYCATAAGSAPSDSNVISPKSCPANTYDLENAYLAYHIQKRLVSAIKTGDRGARHKRFKVIADTAAPSILVEMGFLTNAADRDGLSKSQRQMLTATAIANAIEEYKHAVAPKTLQAAPK